MITAKKIQFSFLAFLVVVFLIFARKPYENDASLTTKAMAPPLRPEEHITPCPDDDCYVGFWAMKRPVKKHKWTVVDVGSNKGYSVVGMLEALMVPLVSKTDTALDIYAYAKAKGATPKEWRHALSGACCEPAALGGKGMYDDIGDKKPIASGTSNLFSHPWFKQYGADIPSKVESIEVWCIDGAKANIDYNRYYFENLKTRIKEKNLKSPELIFHYHNLAISNTNGTASFPQFPLGMETGSLGGGGSPVEKTTLDLLLPADLDEIDVLLTDTEGFDFDVQTGASRWIKTGKVGILVFELHNGPNKMPLSQLVKGLEEDGFSCYFPIQGNGLERHVVKIEYDSWRPEWDTISRGWANAVCIGSKRFPELIEVFDDALAKLEKNANNLWCDFPTVNRFFFKFHPTVDWSWALEAAPYVLSPYVLF